MNNIIILYVCHYFITNPLTCAVTNECCLDLTSKSKSKCACYVGAGIWIFISVLYQVVFVLLQMEI